MAKADVPPTNLPQVPPTPASDMPSYSAQVLFEMNHTLGRIEGKLDGLVQQVGNIDTRTQSLERHWALIKGGVAVSVVLIPICAGIVWYSLGERINRALDIDTGSINRSFD